MTDERRPAPLPPASDDDAPEPVCGQPWTASDDWPPATVILPCSREAGHIGLHYFQVELVAFA